MEARVEGEAFLNDRTVSAGHQDGIEDDIPAMGRHHTRYHDEGMPLQQMVSECLLTDARDPWMKPVRIWDFGRFDHTDLIEIDDSRRREDVSDGIEGLEGLVDRDFQDRGGGIDGGVDGSDPSRIPAAADTIAAFATVPGRAEHGLIQSPQHESARPQRGRQRRHV